MKIPIITSILCIKVFKFWFTTYKMEFQLLVFLLGPELDLIFIAGVNTLCGDMNRAVIDDRESCNQSVSEILSQEPSAKFGGQWNYAYYPGGCWMHNISKKVYFNMDFSGVRNYKAKPLCMRKPGKTVLLPFTPNYFFQFSIL